MQDGGRGTIKGKGRVNVDELSFNGTENWDGSEKKECTVSSVFRIMIYGLFLFEDEYCIYENGCCVYYLF